MKTFFRLTPVLLILFILITSCGYRNPNVYSGPEKDIFITTWKNRTSELRLDMKIYQSLVRWFQKSGSITVSKARDEADLILAGEIVSIELPTNSYGANNNATEVKIKLRIRYIMKDIASGKIVMEVPNELWTEEYLTGGSKSETQDNEDEALAQIIEDLSQKIYRKAIKELPKL